MNIEELAKTLSHGTVEDRQTAAYELGQTKSADAIPHLIDALSDSDLDVRVYAIQGLRDIPDSNAVRPLCQLIAAQQSEPLMVSNVCRALGAIADSEAIPTLIPLLDSPDPFTRYDVAFALGEIGDPCAIPALQRLTSDTTKPERMCDDGVFQSTVFTVGEQAERAIGMIEKN